MQTDLASLQINRLPCSIHSVLLHIDETVRSERLHRRAGLRVETYQPVAGCHIHDPFIALPVGPERQAAPRKLSCRGTPARTFVLPMHPKQLARNSIERNHRPSGSCRGIDDALYHERSSFELKLRPRAEGIGLEPPSYFEFVEVARIDLIERRVTVIAEITGIGGPLPIGGTRLAED